MNPDRLNAVGEAYLRIESATVPLHVASLGIFEADGLCDSTGALRLSDIRRRIDSRLDALPRLRQRLASVPLGLHRPLWIDDERFDVAHHIDAVELERPHDEATLLRLVERTVMERLDRARPLWHLRFVTGLADDRVALIERAHHAMVDGVSGVDISLVLLDAARDCPDAEPSRWRPRRGPTDQRLLRDAISERVSTPLEAIWRAGMTLGRPTVVRDTVADLGRALSSLRRSGVVAPPTSLNGELGHSRHLLVDRQNLDDVRNAGAPLGATVNDVVLCAVAGGLRDLFLARGEELPSQRVVKVLIPVSTRSDAESGSLGNRVGGLVASLPVGIGDPAERLRTIVAITRGLKDSREATASDLLLRMADLLPMPLEHLVLPAVERQSIVNMVVTNIPGPDFPLYALGSRMLEAFPVVPLGARMTLEVAVLSYDGALNLCVTADRHSCPDAEMFLSGMRQGFAALGADGAGAARGLLSRRRPEGPAVQRHRSSAGSGSPGFRRGRWPPQPAR